MFITGELYWRRGYRATLQSLRDGHERKFGGCGHVSLEVFQS